MRSLKHLVPALVLVLAGHALVAQPFIPNAGLEEVTPVCGLYTPVTFNTGVDGWYTPAAGSPDIFHLDLPTSCPNAAVGSVSPASWGSETPYDGRAMAALITYCLGCATETREYMQAELLEPLEPGAVYRASMQVSRADRCRFATDGLGMYFSTAPPSNSGWTSLGVQAQVKASTPITEADGWTTITGEFLADGPYQFITIGNFSNDAGTVVQDLLTAPLAYAVYFIDGITLERVDHPFQITGAATVCAGDSVLLNASPVIAPVFWSSLGSSPPGLGTGASLWVAPGTTTTYQAICAGDTALFTVTVLPAPVVDLGSDTVLCTGEALLLCPPSAEAQWLWQDGSEEPCLTISEAGSYWVTITEQGCAATDTLQVSVEQLTQVALPPDSWPCEGEPLLVDLSGHSGPVTWSDGFEGALRTVDTSGTYTVTLEGTWCTFIHTFTVVFVPCAPDLELPNVFTPNGDGRNDRFVPTLVRDIAAAELVIYDRWGKEAYRTTDLMRGWSGNGWAEGVYYWVLSHTGLDGVKRTDRGHVTLLR